MKYDKVFVSLKEASELEETEYNSFREKVRRNAHIFIENKKNKKKEKENEQKI